ncbi:glycoside hydrolase family 5 protein [Hebeloma cylindrosporum]|uniref:mannan endo-1,4-beta-mannosidase n=1 Tax=Hebeloma cylindrosporum TaxID=76867 RepID=A0A0C3CZ86_HEBCY|nr:glycoside hydrolase family 5 protein [Hebeloma cylindrosporum h7]
MYLAFLLQVLLSALLVSAVKPTRTLSKRQTTPPSKFVTSQNGQFMFNGSTLDFVGTNAYWLPVLNSDEDIDFTLGNLSAAGIKIVRTWAFNDVGTIPVNGTWFQLIANGTTVINEGPNGLQKLDTVVKLAEKHGIFVLLSLTNNWNPLPLDNQAAGISARDTTPGTNKVLPRNALSNDYGGMDAYVREFSDGKNHDAFYVNPTILAKFTNYTTQIVSRYVESPAIFAWEIANDPRYIIRLSLICIWLKSPHQMQLLLPATVLCNTHTITKFHSTIAQHINQVDPNHLVSSGNQGFFCVDCPKLFPRVAPPPPQTSSTPSNNRRRSPPKPLTKRGLLQERKAIRNKVRNLQKRTSTAGGIRIRGRWMSTETKRQSDDQGIGPSFDGSYGIDSEDILNIPQIGFGTFQLFPDQNSYGIDDPTLPAFNNTVNQGLDWIRRHADVGKLFGKPVTLNGFGLVTQANAPSFVPFNQTQAPFGPDSPPSPPAQQPFGITDAQRDDAYAQWLHAGLQNGLQGMLQYQWSQGNLTTGVGTAISPTVSGTGVSPTVSGTGLSPNDGYSIQGAGLDQAVGTIQQAAQALGPDQQR